MDAYQQRRLEELGAETTRVLEREQPPDAPEWDTEPRPAAINWSLWRLSRRWEPSQGVEDDSPLRHRGQPPPAAAATEGSGYPQSCYRPE